MYKNKMHLEFESKSENEKFARVTVAAFATRLNPILEELADLKTAVSEAVTNAIVHGYDEGEGIVYLDCIIEDNVVTVIVEDKGVGLYGRGVHRIKGRLRNNSYNEKENR